MTIPLASQQHDHSRCIDSALTTAQQLCAESGVRLTQLREQVLKIVWQSHQPLGAYAVMDVLSQESTRRVAPPTVYRALDFLLEQGLVHRVNLLNAYIGCSHPDEPHQHNFLICKKCDIAVEFEAPKMDKAICDSAREQGFEISSQSVEVLGLCSNCAGTDSGQA